METSVPDIPRIAGPTPALVHDGLEGFPQLIVTPRRWEPLLEQPQDTVAPTCPLDPSVHLRRAGIRFLGTTIWSVLPLFHYSWLTRTGSRRFSRRL